jgi:tetratricopeptide (TPR) repeat protein
MAKKRRGTKAPPAGKSVPVARARANSVARLEIVARNGSRRTQPGPAENSTPFTILGPSGAGLATNGPFAIVEQQAIAVAPEPKHPAGPREQAQIIAVEAMQAETTRTAMRLARKAVAIDPLCLDARTILAVNVRSRSERIVLLEDALSDAEQRLGKEFFRKHMGQFARYEEGRAYLRALYSISMELLADGQIEDCIENIEALLDLDPEDEMALRDQLLSLYLRTDDVESADDVLTRFEDDGSALFEWARVLVSHIFRQFDDASRQLQAARAANPRVEAYLTGGREFPTEQPVDAEPGTDEEAAYCAFHLATAWQLRPLASIWLSQGGPPAPASVIDLVGMFKR